MALNVKALSVQLICELLDNPSICFRAIDWKDGPTVSDADKNYKAVLLVKGVRCDIRKILTCMFL